MSDTPRTNFVAHETGDPEWNRFPNRFGRMMAHACILERELTAQKEQLRLCNVDQFSTAAELAAQKEHYRVLEEEMLVLGDERNAAVLDAKENMEIANEFKCLMEEYRQRADAAHKQSHIDAIDAERYRWLRVQNWFSSPLAVVTKPIEAIKLGYDCPSGNRLDALIDDSMREMK